MKLIVLNLARNSTENDLQHLFGKYGAVESCTLVLDTETGKSKGFGFVKMPDDAEAQAAIDALHGTRVKTRRIKVKTAAE